MKHRYFCDATKFVVCLFLISGCEFQSFGQFKHNSIELVKSDKISNLLSRNSSVGEVNTNTKPLKEILNGALTDQNDGEDFASAIASALRKDPIIISKKKAVDAKLAAVEISEALKEYQVTGTVYGGVEDVTDNTKGLAIGLNASRLVFDGGLLDSQIAAKTFDAEAAKLEFQVALDERAYRLGEIWLEFEKYKSLQKQIDDRLAILDPLIDQLEQVAKAGIGDVSKVTSAQRTVSGIRVIQTSVAEGLAKAQLEFLNAYGSVDENITYDSTFISTMLPNKVDKGLAEKSPLLLAKYANYQSALARLEAVKAKNNFNIGLEARAMRPFAGSGYDSDESIGLVAKKTLFNGGMFESEISEAQAIAKTAHADVESAYRQGVRTINSAMQSIESMSNAIVLARKNAKITSDEIIYLRQQLIIGGSTLDSVLAAEARLYEAESTEINFLADKRRAELLIASTLGLLSAGLDAM